jgi:hypothetical protein
VTASGRRREQAKDFVPGRVVNGVRQTFAWLDDWLAQFSAGTLFTVVLQAARGGPRRTPAVWRDEHHRQVSAAGVRRLAQRHGDRLRRIEPEPISAAAWSRAIERFGTCE